MMKVAVVLALVACAFAAPSPMAQFREFKSTHGKTYTSASEEAKRFAIFNDNLAIIAAQNAKFAAGESTYELGVNQFADLTAEEFATTYLSPMKRTAPKNVEVLDTTNTADSVDWRQKGAVTPIKNQGQCGSCWSFSTTGSTEGAAAIASGTLKSLSEQQLMDCSKAEGNMGCNGGLMDYAFEYIIKNGGIDSEEDYSYTARDGTCNAEKAAKHVVSITGYKDVQHDSDAQLEAAVNIGPVSVAIEADKSAFQLYKSGVFDDVGCGTQLDHGVLVVGYGESTKKYWIVKNSWGESWGDEGYIMIARSEGAGICGINMQPSYPTGAKVDTVSDKFTLNVDALSGPAPNTHYEDPNPNGCQSDEEEVEVTGIAGKFCSPSCSATSACPTDVPAGVTAKPECVLEKPGSSSPTNCALICTPGANDECGDKASCKKVSGAIGVCTYDS